MVSEGGCLLARDGAWRAGQCTIPAVPTVGYELWFFPDSVGFGEPVSRGPLIASPPPETVLYKSVYLNRTDQDSLREARLQIAARETWGRDDVYLLRPAPSSDGPPVPVSPDLPSFRWGGG